MSAPYSEDLRMRVVAAYEAGEGTQAEIAKRFKISTTTVKRYWQRYMKTGSFSSKKGKVDRPPGIPSSKYEALKLLLSKHPDAILSELCVKNIIKLTQALLALW